MPKAKQKEPVTELGTKHLCLNCQTKFYDLGKPQLECPKCKSSDHIAPPTTATVSRLSVEPKATPSARSGISSALLSDSEELPAADAPEFESLEEMEELEEDLVEEGPTPKRSSSDDEEDMN